MSNEWIEQLKEDEGFRPLPYLDTHGNMTIGYGLNLNAGMTKKEAELVMLCRCGEYREQLSQIFPWFNSLSDNRQGVLISMAYNMGVNDLLDFEKMIAAIERKDWTAAGHEILDSAAGREFPGRYQDYKNAMIIG